MSAAPRMRLLRSAPALWAARRGKSTVIEQTPCARSSPPPPRRLSQPTSFSHPWLLHRDEVTPGISHIEYVSRRRALHDALPPRTLALFPAAAAAYMSGDVPYLYRYDSMLRYLTGLCEPGAVLAVTGGANGGCVLFTAPRDRGAEQWDGPRIGADADVGAFFGVDMRSMAEFGQFLEDVLPQVDEICLDGKGASGVCEMMAGIDVGVRERFEGLWKRDVSPQQFVDPLRLVKSEAEIALLRGACDAVAAGLNDAMGQLHAGGVHDTVAEKDIESVIEYSCKRRGAKRMSFPCVVAGGANGTVLHYMDNSQRIKHGELVMVDAGCEMHGYSSDVSRTWPVSGKFTSPQLDLYSLVLDVQKRLIDRTRVSTSLDDLHINAAAQLTQGLLDLGFLRDQSLHSALESGAYARYFPHATGHFLGMDVHDTHEIPKSIPLQPGMVVTIEPGLYVHPDDASAPEHFRGIGIRIEDDVLLKPDGEAPEILSVRAVKEVKDVQQLVGSAQAKWTVE